MASLSFILGIFGNVISLLMFASPIKTFRQIVKAKSTENYNGLPYITTLLTTSLWTFYGLLKPDGLLVVTVNGAGAALHVLYVILFILYAPKTLKMKYVKLALAVDVAFLGAVIMVTLLAFHGGIRITLVGMLCAALTIGMYAAPLSALRTVIKMKSVKYMPFLLSFFQFLNGGVWSAYAVLIKDYYIGVPNWIGFLFGSAQLVLYTMYKKKATSEEDGEKKEGLGSAHHVKGSIQMEGLNENNEDINMKNRSLNKGSSVPKPSIIRQYSQNIVKTFSSSPHELGKLNEKDIEKGVPQTR